MRKIICRSIFCLVLCAVSFGVFVQIVNLAIDDWHLCTKLLWATMSVFITLLFDVGTIALLKEVFRSE